MLEGVFPVLWEASSHHAALAGCYCLVTEAVTALPIPSVKKELQNLSVLAWDSTLKVEISVGAQALHLPMLPSPFCCAQGHWAVLPEKGEDVSNLQGHPGLGLWAATPCLWLTVDSADRFPHSPQKTFYFLGAICSPLGIHGSKGDQMQDLLFLIKKMKVPLPMVKKKIIFFLTQVATKHVLCKRITFPHMLRSPLFYC